MMKMKKAVLLALLVLAPLGARADWSCECDTKDDDGEKMTLIIDGKDEKAARKICVDQWQGFAHDCQSQGRGDR